MTLGSTAKVQLSGKYALSQRYAGFFGMFISPLPGDTGMAGAISQMAVSEGGTFAFVAVIHTVPLGRLNAALEAHYSNIRIRDKTDFALYRLRPVLEFVLLPKSLSVYVAWNSLSVGGGVSNFRNTFGTDVRRTLGYPDFGINGLVNLGDQAVWLNLQFLAMNGSLKSLRGSNDDVVPVLRLSYQRNLFGSP